jgi:hypothetical protein
MPTKSARYFLIVATVLPFVGNAIGQPVITKQPTNASVSLGASAKFQVSATSARPPILYQWRFALAKLEGKTNLSLNLTNIQRVDAGDYDVVLADNSGSVTSRVAHLEVDPTFMKITAGPIVNDGGYGFGCAWGDYDGDGQIDLFVCNYSDGSFIQHDFLYHNNGDGTFQRITTGPMVNANAWATGASWGDYDNDGKPDLFVTRPGNNGSGPNTLYHNEGNGKFTKITNGLLVTQVLKSHAGVWADVENDGFIDLFVVNFAQAGSSTPAPDNYLYHNNTDGTFTRVSFGAKAVGNGDSFDVAAADFNNDGWIDLVVPQGAARDPQNTLLYANNRTGTFTLLTNSIFFNSHANSAACAWGDYDNDGLLDLFVCNNPEKTAFLYHNDGNGIFTLVTNTVVGAEIRSWAGCAWGDYDNDGWLDLFVARIGDYTSSAFPMQNNCLYHNNRDGTFTKITAGSLANEAGYSFGCAWGDYNNDGFLDLFVSNGWAQASANNFLYRNAGNANNWANFRLVGTVSNRSAIGAKVRVKATIGEKTFWQLREISGGSGHGCQNDLRANFGLGGANSADIVRIEWPSGAVQEFHDVAAKNFLTITEPPRLQGSGVLPDGSFGLSLSGGIGFTYDVQRSSDLTQWTTWTTLTNLSRTIKISDPNSGKFSQRFYRAVQVQP